MTHKKRNILAVLIVAALAIALCAVIFTACGKKEKTNDGATTYGEIVVMDDGAVSHSYSLETGKDVYSFMQDKYSDFDKEHAKFDHFEYNGEELTPGLVMTDSVTLTAVYQIEITLEINAKNITGYEEWQDEGDYTHMEDLDVRYYALAGETFTAGIEYIEGLTDESGKNSSTARTITVSSDYTKNTIPLYYERDYITIRFYTNYPADSGMTDSGYVTENTYFGYPVTLPTGYTCEGYIMLGWSSTQRATSPEYAVDSVSSSLIVWNSEAKAYEPAEVSEEKVTFYPTTTTPMYVVWGKGYTDLFGNGDVVYILEEGADVVYLSRGGFLYESSRKVGELYYFENSDTGVSYRLRLSDDYVFAYYDESRVAVYYEFEFVMSGSSLSGNEYSNRYIVFSETDEFVYHVGSSESRGIYRTDGYGLYYLTYKSGSLAGETATIVLGTYGDDDVFMFENEDEADMGVMPIGAVVYYDDVYGLISTYYLTTYYYLYLDGFNNCLYYNYGTSYTYTYCLDGNTLYLFYYSSYYGYQLSGIFKRFMTDSGDYAWFLYDSSTDGTFNVYEDGEIVGTIECDGYLNAIYTDKSGKSQSTYYYTDYFAVGVAMYLGVTLDGETGYADYIINYDESGYYAVDTDGNYMVSVLPRTYTELYRYDQNGMWYDMIILDYAGEGTCAYVVVGYDYYGYGYYFTVLTGRYETYRSESYPGLEYCVFTVNKNNAGELEEYFYTYIYYYYAALDLEDLANVKSLAFVVSSVSSSYYTYPINVWMWYDPEESNATGGEPGSNPWAGETSVTYFEEYEEENFEITFIYGEYELDENGDFVDVSSVEANTGTLSGKIKMIILDGGLLYGTFTYNAGESNYVTIDIYGYYYGATTVDDKENDAYTATCLFVDFGVTQENYKDDRNYYIYGYTYIYVTFDNGSMKEVTNIPVYIYSATMEDGPSEDTYLSYNGISWDEELTYTYVTGSSSYTGTVTLKEDSNDPFGNNVYTFTSACGGVAFDFVYMYYGSTTVFMVYKSEDVKTYTGPEGIEIVLDPIGYQLIYKDAGGESHNLTYSYFNVVLGNTGGNDDDSYLGHYGAGYIQLLVDGVLYSFDILDEETKTADNLAYDFTVRGSEFGEYYIVDNLLSQYIIFLDGYGSAYLYSVEADENGDLVRVGSGEYEIIDTYITLTECHIGEEGTGVDYTLEAAEMDYLGLVYTVGDGGRVTYMSYGGIYINSVEYTGRYISYADMSVLELESCGVATRYCSDGSVESGVYTWLDEYYFYYVNDAGTFGNVFFVTGGYNVREETYSVFKYFSADMSEYIEFTSNGRVTFDYGNTYYYYTVSENDKVTVYVVPSVAERGNANEYGYLTYDFGALGETFTTQEGKTYYNILWNMTSFTLSRKDDEEDKYNFGYLGYTYSVGDLQLLSAYTDETGSLGYIYMTYDGAAAGYGYAYVYMVENTEKESTEESDILIYVYVDSSSEYSYSWGYYDYIYYRYTIEVDLSTWTYSITDEKLYIDSYMYEYLYYSYYYGSSYATYYYSYITFEWDVSENGVITEGAAYGYFLPYLYYDVADGAYVYTFIIDGAPFTLDENGIFTIELEGSDGKSYELQLYLDYSYYCVLYYGYYGFMTLELWQPEYYEYTTENESEKYTLSIGYVIYSTFYNSGTRLLDFHVYYHVSTLGDYVESDFDTVAILSIDDKIYYLVEVETSGGKRQYYYEISLETGEVPSMTVALAEAITRYYMEGGASYVDVYLSEETDTNEIVLVYIESEGYYSVYSSECDENGVYTIVISSGTYYVILTEKGEEGNGEARMTKKYPSSN